jgi:hypothetical protein
MDDEISMSQFQSILALFARIKKNIEYSEERFKKGYITTYRMLAK